MRKIVPLILLTVLGAGALALYARLSAAPQAENRPGLAGIAPAPDLSAFPRVEGPRPFDFPLDHGAHPDYQTEWWYYTGNLSTPDGRRFGYQLTFFRRALLPSSQTPPRQSGWSTGQVLMAHFAVSDIGANRFHAFERLSRCAAGLAGALPIPQQPERPFRVWIDDWQVQESAAPGACPQPDARPCRYTLTAAQGDVAIELNLEDMRGPLLQGEDGFSRKGPEVGQASHYYSLTRLQADGTITIDGRRFPVSGWSWMDHEWSTSALSEQQIGWDWFSIQLDGGVDLMVFQIRRADGSIDPFSSGMLVYPDGRSLPLDQQAFSILVQDSWKSPHSGAVYPARWSVSVPEAGLELEISPHMADQELNVSYSYWEGAVRVQGRLDGAPVAGNGYVELTGYSQSLGGEF
jgi:predicted secreted hydrolase